MTCFLAINIFHFFWTCCWTKEMIYLTKNSSASPQKKDLENSLYKSFATLSNFWYLDIYVQLLSERRCWSKNLSYIRFSLGLFTEVANHFFSDFRFLKKWAWIIIISIHFLFRAGHICQCGTCIKHMSVWHMYQTYVSVAHVSNRLRLDTFFTFILFFWNGISNGWTLLS